MFTRAEENYLKSIFHLEFELKAEVSTNTIAEKMNTKASSVTDMIKRLAEKKMLDYTPYQGVNLTEKGKLKAAKVIRKHRLWELFLVEELNFNWDEVHTIAEQLEHVQSDELITRIDDYLGNPGFDPHGDPIPNKKGELKRKSDRLLSEMEKGQSGICVGVKESGDEFLRFLDKRNIGIGTHIHVFGKEGFDGSMTIRAGADKRFFISRKIAENLYI